MKESVHHVYCSMEHQPDVLLVRHTVRAAKQLFLLLLIASLIFYLRINALLTHMVKYREFLP